LLEFDHEEGEDDGDADRLENHAPPEVKISGRGQPRALQLILGNRFGQNLQIELTNVKFLMSIYYILCLMYRFIKDNNLSCSVYVLCK
jgi:hypothetical protein